jgi:hypothetical protein
MTVLKQELLHEGEPAMQKGRSNLLEYSLITLLFVMAFIGGVHALGPEVAVMLHSPSQQMASQ